MSRSNGTSESPAQRKATVQDVTGYQTVQDVTGYQKVQDVTGYQKVQDVTGYQKVQDVTGYKKVQDVTGYQTVQDVTGYQKKNAYNMAWNGPLPSLDCYKPAVCLAGNLRLDPGIRLRKGPADLATINSLNFALGMRWVWHSTHGVACQGAKPQGGALKTVSTLLASNQGPG